MAIGRVGRIAPGSISWRTIEFFWIAKGKILLGRGPNRAQRAVGETLKQPLVRRLLEAVAEAQLHGQVPRELDAEPGAGVTWWSNTLAAGQTRRLKRGLVSPATAPQRYLTVTRDSGFPPTRLG